MSKVSLASSLKFRGIENASLNDAAERIERKW